MSERLRADERIVNIILFLERAKSVMNYLVDDGIFSWAAEHYEQDGWHDVQLSFDRTGQFMNISAEYLEKALEEARELEDIIWSKENKAE